MENTGLLSIVTFLPVAGAVVVLFLPKNSEANIKFVSAVTTGLTLLLSLGVFFCAFDTDSAGRFQLVDRCDWIPRLGIQYKLAVDGLSLPLVCLTTLLSFLSVCYSWRVTHRVKEYFAFFLLLETGMIGVFCALDVFLFYIFWEVSLVPMYFIIGIWGHDKKEYAAIKFFLYTLVGSLAMLLAMLGLYFHFHTFDFATMIQLGAQQDWVIPAESLKGVLIFWGLFLGFAIKVPLFPFHTWLPLAHVEAPTAGSVILAGVLLKMGAYGFIRFSLPILPQQCQRFAYAVAVLALISIIYGALCAMAQKDIKRLVAYSSVNHMGYVMLGVAAAMAGRAITQGQRLLDVEAMALNGAVLQMVSHGIITGSLFLLVGVIYDRAHTHDLDAFGGIWPRVPIFGGILILAALASLGLPGLAGFVAEFPIFIGAFGVYKLFACLGVIGIVVTAGYFLWMIQRMLLGPFNEQWSNLEDMDFREKLSLYPLAALMIIIGIMPMWLLDPINNAMTEMLARIHAPLLP